MSAPLEVWLVTIIGGECDGETHTFSSVDRARDYADTEPEITHLIYSSVVDHPELSRMVMQ